jgi:2-alkyl-3-oxoalkanoate reductase
MRIFLTGGTGLIGSHVAERLRRRGHDVVALVRASSDTTHLGGLGCELVQGDLADPPEALAAPMGGCGAVIHAAAKVFERGGRAAFLAANVTGTESILRAAARSAPRVVHLSSVAVYSGVRPDPALTEDHWTLADPSRQAPYAASKHLSERTAWRMHEEGAIQLTALRPSVVYGERDRAAAPIMIRFGRLPLVALPGGGRSRLPLVYAGNVARGVLAALERDQSVGRAYNLAMDHPVTGREMAQLLATALGRPSRVLPLPGGPLRGLAAVADWAARLLPWVPPTDLRRAVRSLDRDNPYDSSRARLELGWTNLIAHEEAVRRTVAWWRSKEAAA